MASSKQSATAAEELPPPGSHRWTWIPQNASGDLKLTPLISKVCNWCTAGCLILAAWCHLFYEYSEVKPCLRHTVDPAMPWYLHLTANAAMAGLVFEACWAVSVRVLGLVQMYNDDLAMRRRLRLNVKMMCVFTMLSTFYNLMAFDFQLVHHGWIAEYHGGDQTVYSVRFAEWTCCAPVVLSISGQLQHAADGSPRNGLIPSALLTGIYCIISWQGLVVKDAFAAWVLIIWAFVSYFVASVEQLAFAWWVKDQGRGGPLRAALLVYLVIMMGLYGLFYLLPIPGLMSSGLENKLYCLGDMSFKWFSSIMLMVTNDLCNNVEMYRRADLLAQDMARIIDTASVPIFGVDVMGVINQWNVKSAQILGVSEADIVGLPITDMFMPSDRKKCKEMIERALEFQETPVLEASLTIPIRLRGDAPVDEGHEEHGHSKAHLTLSAAPRVNKLGVVTGVTFMGYDLTQVSSYKEAEDRKTRFLAVMSHELRSPLHGIIGLSEYLLEEEEVEDRRRSLGMIANCSKRLLELVVNIMDLASMTVKPKSGSPTEHFSNDPVELPKILEEVLVLVKRSSDKRGKPLVSPQVELVNALRPLPIIQADAYKCTQVFYNLVTNACKFTKKGSITVSSEVDADEDSVQISVSDTGVGISLEHMERIFEPFEQEDSSECRTHDGLGLGLSIAREVVRRHNGHITVKSQVGVGTTFTVHLPVSREKSICSPMASEASGVVRNESSRPLPLSGGQPTIKIEETEERPPRKPLILSVDDDLINQMVLERLLSPTYTIHKAMDGEQACEYLRKSRPLPDMMLLDSMMPGMSGMEVLKEVRESLQIGRLQLPIIMVSAAGQSSAVIQALEMGCCDYVMKPFDGRVLKARIEIVLCIKEDHDKQLARLPQSRSCDGAPDTGGLRRRVPLNESAMGA